MAKKRIRLGITALIVLMGVILGPGATARAGDHASATLRLVAMVTTKVKLQVARETAQIAATLEDLDRGYLEMPGAAELLVWTNSKSGLSITARAEGDLHGTKGSSIPISALSFSVNGEAPRPFTAGDQVVYVGKGQEIRSSKRINYRLDLDWKTEPDTYSVDITYTVIGN